MLTSRWNNTLLSTGIGWNFCSVSLLLGHIQPVATENTAWTKPALCCEEIAALVAVGFGITLCTLPINSSLQTPTKPLFHHSLRHPCGGVSSTRQAVYCCSDRERKTEVSSFQDSVVNTAQTFSEERINSYLYVVDAFVVDSQHQKFSSMSSPLLSNCHRTSVKIKETFQTHELWHQISVSVTQTHMHISTWKTKKICLLFGGISETPTLLLLNTIFPLSVKATGKSVDVTCWKRQPERKGWQICDCKNVPSDPIMELFSCGNLI